MGDHDFKLKKVHLYAQRPVNINFLCSADPKLALVPASRYDCHILHTKQDAFFARKSVNTNVSLSAAQKLALVPASRQNCYAN